MILWQLCQGDVALGAVSTHPKSTNSVQTATIS